jgi:hypothetical protein
MAGLVICRLILALNLYVDKKILAFEWRERQERRYDASSLSQ